METVLEFDNQTYMKEKKSPIEMNEYGIPTTLQTSHMKDDFDPYRYSNIDHSTSFWGTVLNLMIIVSCGPNLLTIPIFFLGIGYMGRYIGILLLICLYVYSMYMVNYIYEAHI